MTKNLTADQELNPPRGWVYAKVGDLCHLINGRAFKPNEWSPVGLPIIRIQNLNDVNANFNYCNFAVDKKFVVNIGQLLFAWSGTPGTSFGAHIWNKGKAILNQHIFKVEFNENYINKYFFMYALNHNVAEYISKAHGGVGLAHITKGKFENSLILLPPFFEQTRIISKLEELFTKLDAGIDALKKAKIHLKNYRQSLLRYAFEGKLTEKWREVNRSEIEHSSFLLERIKGAKKKRSNDKTAEKSLSIDTRVLPEPPDCWVWTSVGQLLLDARYGTSKKCWYETNGTPVLRIPNIINGSISLQDLKYTHLSYSEKESLRLTHGDVIVIRTNGSLGLVGRSAVVTETKDITAFASYLIRLTPVIPVVGTYINVYLQSKRARNFIERNARTTAGQHNVNLRTLNCIPIPLPSVSEQNKMIELIQFQFSIIHNIVKVIEDCFRYAEKLRQSILMTAFAGKLVPQDPTDEPATILLKRIIEEKAKHEMVEKKVAKSLTIKIDSEQTRLV
jgi:type I restriction enzyme, S subunit